MTYLKSRTTIGIFYKYLQFSKIGFKHGRNQRQSLQFFKKLDILRGICMNLKLT